MLGQQTWEPLQLADSAPLGWIQHPHAYFLSQVISYAFG